MPRKTWSSLRRLQKHLRSSGIHWSWQRHFIFIIAFLLLPSSSSCYKVERATKIFKTAEISEGTIEAAGGIRNEQQEITRKRRKLLFNDVNLCFIDYKMTSAERERGAVEIYKKLLKFLVQKRFALFLLEKQNWNNYSPPFRPNVKAAQWKMIDWHSHDLRKQIPLLCICSESQGQNQMANDDDDKITSGERKPSEICVNFRYLWIFFN